MERQKKQVWVIGISGTEMDNVVIQKVYGTRHDVKKHLVHLLKEVRKEDPDSWEFGVPKLKDVTERRDGSLYACACWRSHHNDYAAYPDVFEVKHLGTPP